MIWLGHSQQYAASNVPTSKHYFYQFISLQTGGLEAGGAGEEKEVQSPERREGGGEVCHQGESGHGMEHSDDKILCSSIWRRVPLENFLFVC